MAKKRWRGIPKQPQNPNPQKESFLFWKAMWFLLSVPAALYGYYEGAAKLPPRIELRESVRLISDQPLSTQFVVKNPSLWELRNIQLSLGLRNITTPDGNRISGNSLTAYGFAIPRLRRGRESVFPIENALSGFAALSGEFTIRVSFESRLGKHTDEFKYIIKESENGVVILPNG